MSHPSGRSQYVVLFENGSGSDPVDLLTLREMISAGLVGVRDRISKDGSEPTEFYLFDELVDLWDVENVTFDIGGDPRDEAPDSGPPPTQSPFTMDSQIPSATSAEPPKTTRSSAIAWPAREQSRHAIKIVRIQLLMTFPR